MRRGRRRIVYVLGFGALVLMGASSARGAEVEAACQYLPAAYAGKASPVRLTDRAALAAGQRVYETGCALCHGTTGRGDGPAAGLLRSTPANFAEPAFRDRLPIDCNFYRIAEGVPGTDMRGWKWLGEVTLWQVLAYECTLARAAPTSRRAAHPPNSR